MDSAGLSQNLATLDLGTINTTQQSADVIASPVSYTHLDVYKRQAKICGAWCNA